jgi:alcohol dehydrogenase class IV
VLETNDKLANVDLDRFFSDGASGRLHLPTTFYWGSGFTNNIPGLIANREVEVFIDSYVYENFKFPWLSELNITNLHLTSGTPWVEDVEKYCSEHQRNAESLLVIGGGSTADFAKGVVAMRSYGEISELGVGSRSGMQSAKSSLPEIIGVPTTIGSGAESSRYFVLYSRESKAKVHGKSWSLIAKTVVVDPDLLKDLPIQVAISSAFDSFVHYWESLICKHESTFTTRMFSNHGISEVITNLSRILENRDDLDSWMNLGLNASIAGCAISNTRTGNVHEAAGALLERVNLSHGETLMVFARVAFEQYKDEVSEALNQALIGTKFSGFDQALSWWEDLFQKNGMMSKIAGEVQDINDIDEVRSHIFQRVESDKVWVNKESPKQYLDQDIYELIDLSLASFLEQKLS